MKRHACSCCGSESLTETGVYEICPVCMWEDDPVQAKDPDFGGGANEITLNQARAAWQMAQALKP